MKDRTDMKDDIAGIIFFVAICVWISSIGWGNSWGNKTTVYQEFCYDYKHSVRDCPPQFGIGLTEQDFRVFPEQKMVVAHAGLITRRYENCAIYDAQNWNCNTDGAGSEITLRPPPPTMQKTYQSVNLNHGDYFDSFAAKVSEGVDGPNPGTMFNGESMVPLNRQIDWIDWTIENIRRRF